MAAATEYLIDGNDVNKRLEAYQIKAHMLSGQVFDIIRKKFIKGLAEEIDKAKPQVVRFANLEAITSGPHKDFFHAICGGLAELADSLNAKKIPVTGTIQNPSVLPWNLVSRIDKTFKGLPSPEEKKTQ